MDLGLKDKVILITGGTKGIGGAISKAVARENAIPVFVGRGESSGKEMLEAFKARGVNAHFIQANLNEEGQCKRIVDKVLDIFGKIDALVNNAGVNDNVGLEAGNPIKFANSVYNNLNHYYEMAHYCLPALKESKGTILNISSKVALVGQGGTSGYAASKGAQLALTREWAAELLPYKIRVNAILPGDVMTPLYRSWLDTFDNPAEKLANITRNIPLENRMTLDTEIADLAVFILSEKSGHTTAQWFSPDGGYVHLDRSLT